MPWKLKNPLNKRPPDGVWQCEVDDWLFEGSSPEEVAEKIRSYRSRHNLPIDEPMQEVVDYMCERYNYLGSFYEEEENESEDEEGTIPPSLWNHLEKLLQSREGLGISVDSSIRESICLKCKFNQPHEWGEENEETKRYKRLAMKITNGRYDRTPELGICTLHGHDNSLAVWTKKQSSEEKEGQPELCWIN